MQPPVRMERQRDGQVLGAQDARDPRLLAERVLAELELLLERRVELFEVLEALGIPRLGSDLHLGAGIEAVVQRQLEDLPEVRLPFHGVPGLVGDVAPHARADAGPAGLLEGDALLRAPEEVQGPLDHDVAVDELGHADAGVDDVEDLLQELAAHLLRVAAGERRLGQLQVLGGIEDQVVHLRRRVVSILGEAAERDALAEVGGVLDGDLLAVVVPDLVELDEEELEQVDGFLRTDQAGRLVTLVERLAGSGRGRPRNSRSQPARSPRRCGTGSEPGSLP